MIALITGANSGIGLETAKALVKANYDLIILVRSQQKIEETTKQLRIINATCVVDSYIVDLSDVKEVRTVAQKIKAKYPLIDRLVNNAGYSADQIEFLESGLEKSFVANHLGHFILTTTLLNALETASGRIINVASAAHAMGKFERMFKPNNKALSVIGSYGDGKLANVFFARALAKRLKHATAYSLHPGVVRTSFGSNFTGAFKFGWALMQPFTITAEKGAQTSIYLATATDEKLKGLNGKYFNKSKPAAVVNKELTDANLDKFWNLSEEFSG